MNILEDSITYLVGPIDFAKDQGVGFRKEIREKIHAVGLNLRVLDPCKKVEGLPQDVGEEQNRINKYKDEKDWTSLSKMMKKIVRSDLRCIDYSDFIIAYIDRDVHMCGSYHEIVVALNQKKPVLVIVEGGIQRAPSWIFGICDVELLFNDIDSLVKYLVTVNSGEVKTSDKWVLIRKAIADIVR